MHLGNFHANAFIPHAVQCQFKVFGQVFVMTGGGPYNTTQVLVQYVYRTGFSYFQLGYASAMSVLLFLVILSISGFQFILGKKRK